MLGRVSGVIMGSAQRKTTRKEGGERRTKALSALSALSSDRRCLENKNSVKSKNSVKNSSSRENKSSLESSLQNIRYHRRRKSHAQMAQMGSLC
jgi:hypothetical protein